MTGTMLEEGEGADTDGQGLPHACAHGMHGLIERPADAGHVYLYATWAAGCGVQRRAIKGDCGREHYLPRETLLAPGGGLDPHFVMRRSVALLTAAMPDDVSADPGAGPAPNPAHALRADEAMRAAWREHVAAIPLSARRLAAAFRRAQWPVLAALAAADAAPDLAQDLAVELAGAGTGYIHAVLSLAGMADAEPDTSPGGPALAVLLARALRTPRPAFLAALARRPVNKGAARILARLDEIVPRAEALRLLRLAGDAALRPLLAQRRSIGAALIASLPYLPRACAAAPVLGVLAEGGLESCDRTMLRRITARLKRGAPGRFAAFARAIGQARSAGMLTARLMQWDEAAAGGRGPAHPIPGTARLVPLATPDALADAGRRFRNCLARLEIAEPVYEWRGRHPALVSLDRRAGGAWTLADIKGPENAPVPHATRERIARAVYRQLAARRR